MSSKSDIPFDEPFLSASGSRTTMDSVVSSKLAIEAAFSSAVRATFVGSR